MFAVLRDLIRYNAEFAIGLVLVLGIIFFAMLSVFNPVDARLIFTTIPTSHRPRNSGSGPIRADRTCSGNCRKPSAIAWCLA